MGWDKWTVMPRDGIMTFENKSSGNRLQGWELDWIDSRPCPLAGFRINGVKNSDINARGWQYWIWGKHDSCGSVVAEHGKQQQQHSQTDSYHHGAAAEPFIGQQPWYVQVNQHIIAHGWKTITMQWGLWAKPKSLSDHTGVSAVVAKRVLAGQQRLIIQGQSLVGWPCNIMPYYELPSILMN
jgi:hypothetical protein